MVPPSQIVSIHPYFRIRPGQMERARALLREFVALTTNETSNLYYDFTVRDDVVFCREAYVGAEGLLAHLANIGGVLDQFLAIAEVMRLEIHAGESDIEKLRPHLASMNPEWFVFECGVTRGG